MKLFEWHYGTSILMSFYHIAPNLLNHLIYTVLHFNPFRLTKQKVICFGILQIAKDTLPYDIVLYCTLYCISVKYQ